MNHPIHQVVTFEIVGAYTLRLRFEDGLERTIDFTPILQGELFGPLKAQNLFAQVQIDPEAHTLIWPNGADFDPATLYDWPRYVEDLSARVKEWQIAPSYLQT